MARPFRTIAIVLAAAFFGGCAVHKQDEAPSLTGPSLTGNSLTVTASPNVLSWDGASQSLVTITAIGPNGQPLRNAQLRVNVTADGEVTGALGTLSAQNVVTDANGKATVVFTAPQPIAGVVTSADIAIAVTPTDSSFGNSDTEFATLTLQPTGVFGAPRSPLVPNFTVPTVTVGDTAVFTATVVDATGANAVNQVASFQWTFGDGGTANGQSATHTFNKVGVFPVTLTITDTLGRVSFLTQSVTVGQGTLPTATFVTSPTNPVVNQTINFDASGSTAAPGHTITDFSWNFGDGTSGSGEQTQHKFSQTGTFTVTLKVTDDAGRKSTVATQTVNVGNGNPNAQITVSPPSGPVATTFSFIGSQSTAAPGRTIVSYNWNFGDNTSGSGATTSHKFAAPGTYTVTLVVTDDQGNQGIATATVTVTT